MKLYQVCNDDQFKTWNKRKEYVDYKGKHFVISRVVDYEKTNIFDTRKQALCLDMLRSVLVTHFIINSCVSIIKICVFIIIVM